ncbi:MAG: hypothetical protein ACLGI6_04185 [Gammaproteobacteria bacterium]
MSSVCIWTDHDRRINDFARRAFRDIADMDYIAARLAIRASLFPQFLWSSLQAFEKYFKYILLVNRIPSKKLGHDITAAITKVREHVGYVEDMRADQLDVFKQIAEYGQDRYLIGSYAVDGVLLPQLDQAIWDARRYCQIILPPHGSPAEDEAVSLKTLESIKRSREAPQKFKIHGGLLEEIISAKHHPSHSGLCWQNIFLAGELVDLFSRMITHMRQMHHCISIQK